MDCGIDMVSFDLLPSESSVDMVPSSAALGSDMTFLALDSLLDMVVSRVLCEFDLDFLNASFSLDTSF